ncbi:MAG TPA: hypothetical protein VE944_09565, partial [Nostoc sp.]|nr:hypothetical protein [Nostoc sp.]
MSIPNEPESKNSEIKQESYTDVNGNTHTDLTRTTETVKNNAANPNSYTNGYVQGRNTERGNQQDLAERDNNNASGGLVLGIIITSLLSLVIGGVWYFNQQNNAAVN